MKTLNGFFNLLIQQPCVVESSFWRSLQSWLSATGQRLRSLNQKLKASVPAYRELVGVLTAIVKATSEYRTFAALILLFAVAPFSDATYTLFDQFAPVITWYEGQHWFTYEGVRIEGWYYGNFYWLFYQLGPHLQMVVLLMAAFLLIPEKDKAGKDDKRRWMLVFAAAYPFAKILWTIQVSSDSEIRELFTWPFLLVGTLVAFYWLFAFDYLMNLHYHQRSRPVSTMEGAAKCPDISEAQLRSIIITETQVLKALK